MLRSIVSADELPAATIFHGWALDEDLPDLQVRPAIVDALEHRDRATQALEAAIVYAYLIAATRDEAREAVASMNLIAAREAHDAAEIGVALVWSAAVGGSLPKRRARPVVVEELSPRRREYLERLRSASGPTSTRESRPSEMAELNLRRAPGLKRRRCRKAH